MLKKENSYKWHDIFAKFARPIIKSTISIYYRDTFLSAHNYHRVHLSPIYDCLGHLFKMTKSFTLIHVESIQAKEVNSYCEVIYKRKKNFGFNGKYFFFHLTREIH